MVSIPTVTVAPVPTLPQESLKQRLLDYFKQPGTQLGLSLMVGGMVLAALHPFSGAEGIGATIMAAGLPKLLPDNSTDAIKVRDTANAIAHAAAVRDGAAIEAAAQDIAADIVAAPKP